MRPALFLFVICAICLPLAASAQSNDFQDFSELDIMDLLNQKVVTASKRTQDTREAPAIVAVVTREEIRDMGTRTLLDVLRTIPGIEVYITRYGQYQIAVRGIKTESSAGVKLLIDGHSVNDPFMGGAMTFFDDLLVENIKRVEIIRGPGSALYGANAFLAVINVITLTAHDFDGTEVTAGLGNYHTETATALFSQSNKNMSLIGSAHFYNTDGAQMTVEQDGAYLAQFTKSPGKTQDWKRKYDFSGTLTFHDLTIRTKYAQRVRGDYIGLVGVLNDDSNMNLKQGYVEALFPYKINEKLSIKPRIYYDWFFEEIWFQLFPVGFISFETDLDNDGQIERVEDAFDIYLEVGERTFGGEFQFDYTFSEDHQVTAGLVYDRLKQHSPSQVTNMHPLTGEYLGRMIDVSDSLNWTIEVDRTVTAEYLQYQGNFREKFGLTVGVRHDHYDDFGSTVNPRLALVIHPHQRFGIKAMYGQAFRAPNFRELYDLNNVNTVGNTNLDPETIRTYELGLEWFMRDPAIRWRVNGFRNQIDDIIVLGSGMPQPFVNGGEAEVTGFEAEARWHNRSGLMAFVNYSYQDPQDTENDIRLPDVPTHKGNIGLKAPLGKYLTVYSHALWTSEFPRAENDGRDPVDGLFLIDANLQIENLVPQMIFGISVQNLLDEDYVLPSPGFVPSDHPRPGRNFMITARVNL